jgi:hypothetical protein
MRVLLDECVPKRLLGGHSVRTAFEAGLSGLKNGDLLRRRASDFDCFVTVDRNLQFQQHLPTLPVAVLVIHAMDNRFETLRPVMPRVRAALEKIARGELVHIRV